jgi:hypothetical protein
VEGELEEGKELILALVLRQSKLLIYLVVRIKECGDG